MSYIGGPLPLVQYLSCLELDLIKVKLASILNSPLLIWLPPSQTQQINLNPYSQQPGSLFLHPNILLFQTPSSTSHSISKSSLALSPTHPPPLHHNLRLSIHLHIISGFIFTFFLQTSLHDDKFPILIIIIFSNIRIVTSTFHLHFITIPTYQ